MRGLCIIFIIKHTRSIARPVRDRHRDMCVASFGHLSLYNEIGAEKERVNQKERIKHDHKFLPSEVNEHLKVNTTKVNEHAVSCIVFIHHTDDIAVAGVDSSTIESAAGTYELACSEVRLEGIRGAELREKESTLQCNLREFQHGEPHPRVAQRRRVLRRDRSRGRDEDGGGMNILLLDFVPDALPERPQRGRCLGTRGCAEATIGFCTYELHLAMD